MTGTPMLDAEPLLSIRDLHTCFVTPSGTVRAVNGVSLDVARGEVVGIVGESGSGKTVLALSVMGLVDAPGRVASGSIALDDRELVGATDRDYDQLRGDRIAMIFQQPTLSLDPVMTIGRQIAEALPSTLGRRARKQRSVELLADVGITDPARRATEYAHQFSGGMAQRVMIAIALAGDPDLLIADEPTTALDVTVQAQILDLLQQLCTERDLSIMLISHDLEVVASIADRVAVMYGGRIVEDGPTDSVYDETSHPYTRALLEARPQGISTGGRLPVIPGAVPSLIDLPDGCSFAPRCRERGELMACVEREPARTEVGTSHGVRCWLRV